MITIWKFEIEPDFLNQEIEMPKGAKILSFGLDGKDRLCFWALVDDEAQTESRLMACLGTGWDAELMFGKDGKREVAYVGTVTHGPYVWHLFDLGAVPASEIVEPVTQSSRKETIRA